MSFRNRLALFFVLIVIVPMFAVAFLLFRLIEDSETGKAEAAIAQQHRFAKALFDEQRALAAVAAEVVGRDRVFTGSLQLGDIARARRRATQLLESQAIERIVFVKDGEAIVRVGDKRAIAPAVREVRTKGGRELGSLGVSVIDAARYVERVDEFADAHAVVLNGERVLGTSLERIDPGSLPTGQGEELKAADVTYLVQSFSDPRPLAGQRIRVFTLVARSAKDAIGAARWTAGLILFGFFLVAIACAVLVSRTLQQQISGFLSAARRLAGGDFSAQVPTVGSDEFAELGEEFNKMSRELEGRLAELTQERARVQDSMRRLGEAVGASLDRDALLELVLRTAVDGVGADAGRACMRTNGSGTLQERSSVGSMEGLDGAVAAVETDALQSGRPAEATVGAANAIAHPLRGADGQDAIVGVLSVGRRGRAFGAGDHELLTYLAGRLARSMKNVEVYETVSRESVTDHLTDLLNKRAFDEALSNEVERAKRFGDELGLLLIDLDDFGQFNKVYGVLDGDAVLREVGRVLREGSREIDVPARYGGEELAVVLPRTDLEGAFLRAERIREQIEQLRIPRVDGSGTLRVTASCGVASMRGAAADKDGLVEAAGKALNEAKRSGKNATRRAR